MAKFVPSDLTAVDNEKGHATIVITIRLHHSLNAAMVRDVESKLIVHEMLGGQGAAHLRDQSPEQHHGAATPKTDIDLIRERLKVAEQFAKELSR